MTISTQGAELKVALDGGSSTKIGEVQNVSLGLSRGALETSAIDNATDTGKTYIASGVYDGGELSFDILYDNDEAMHSGTLGALKDAVADTAAVWTILVPHGGGTSTYTFTGYVTGWDVSVAVDDLVKVSASVKITGSVTMPTTD